MDRSPFFGCKFPLANLNYTKSQQQAVRAISKNTHTLTNQKGGIILFGKHKLWPKLLCKVQCIRKQHAHNYASWKLSQKKVEIDWRRGVTSPGRYKGQLPGLENLKGKTFGKEMDGELQVTYLGSEDQRALDNSLGYLVDIRGHNQSRRSS